MFVGSSHQATNGHTSIELMQQVTKEQRYLVVLEQVSDLVEWNTIRMYLPDNKKGSRIVVSTQHLGLAVFCTGLPYLVSELRWFSHGRPSLCAVYRKVAGRSDSDMDILIGKIKRGGVISVCGDGPKKSRVVKALYYRIEQNQGKLDGVKFRGQRWVPAASHPFHLLDFSRRVLLALDCFGFYDGGLQELFDIFGGPIFEKVLTRMKEEDVIQSCREFLRGVDNMLVVIDGLRSTNDWDVIKHSTILPDPAKCCVIVVTDDPGVASYCVDGIEDRVVHASEADMGLPPSSIFSCRREAAIDWITRISDPYLSRRRKIYDGLINSCMAVRSHPVVSVWGIAGVGKSALVQWFFNKKMLSPEAVFPKFRHYCGVIVPHPFTLAELSQRVLLGFLRDYPQKEGAMVRIIERSLDAIQECRVWLRQNVEWLLVLDGLRSTDEWDTVNAAFCLSEPTPGSRIIVVTNEQRLAMLCVNKNDKQVISVQGLEADDSLHLFNRKIHNTDMELSDMDRVSELPKSIMAKCGGLPKVITAVAEYYNDSLDRRKLKDINDNFMHILEGAHSLSSLFSWMQSYLETCKDDLKPCIFYLPIFPIGHNIRFRRLLWRWIAEGYFRGTSSHTAEENGVRLLAELWEFSMIQQQPSSKPVQCQVNGFFHEYITSRPMEDNLVFALEGNCSLSSQQVGQHLTVRDINDTDKNVYESTDFSRLRSLTVFGECRPFMFDPEKIKMRHVRVLDLEDASGVRNIDLHRIVELLPRLKFLSIRGCREVTRLPKSLGGLKQLQTLDVRHTSIVKLPEAILKLQKLQYVRAGTIHTAPWDEGGIMVKSPLAAPGEDAPTASMAPVEDITVPAVAPTARVEDDMVAVAAATSLVEDAPTASTAQAADATMALSAPMAPGEDAPTDSMALEEDATMVVAAPAEDATKDIATPTTSTAPTELPTVAVATQTEPVEDAPTVLTAEAEDGATAVAAPMVPREEAPTTSTTSSARDATVPVAIRTAPVEDAPTASMSPADVATVAVAAPVKPVQDDPTASTAEADGVPMAPGEDAPMTSTTPAENATAVVAAPMASTAPIEEARLAIAAPMTPGEDAPTDSTAQVEDGAMAVAAPTAQGDDAPMTSRTPAEDSTVAVAAPTVPLEDAPTASPPQAEDGTMAIAAPMVPGEDVPMASTAPAEDVVAASTEPVEDAPRGSRQQAEDGTVDVATQMAPEEDTPTTSTTPAEDITVAVAAPTAPVVDAPTAPAEDATMASAEDATTVEADPSAPEINATTVAAAPSGPAENAVTIKVSAADDSTTDVAAPSFGCPHALVPRWLSKLCCRSRHDNAGHGVEVPAGIGKLMNLHTFGVANVGPRKGTLLKELYKLTQLRRLGVCGISLNNIHEFFSAIKGLNHLEALSVRLDKNKDGLVASLDGTIALPPKTLDQLKLSGYVRILPGSWIKEFVNVETLDLDVTLQEQRDMQVILGQLRDRWNASMTSRLCIKPIHDGELRIGRNDEQMSMYLDVLEIVCTSDLQATIGKIGRVEVVKVHCSSRSSLQLSGLQEIKDLEELWLKGSYSDELKQDLQRQLAQHEDKPVMKVLQPRLS